MTFLRLKPWGSESRRGFLVRRSGNNWKGCLTVLVGGQVPGAEQVSQTVGPWDNHRAIHGVHQRVPRSETRDVQVVDEVGDRWLDLNVGPSHVHVDEELRTGTEDVLLTGDDGGGSTGQGADAGS